MILRSIAAAAVTYAILVAICAYLFGEFRSEINPTLVIAFAPSLSLFGHFGYGLFFVQSMLIIPIIVFFLEFPRLRIYLGGILIGAWFLIGWYMHRLF